MSMLITNGRIITAVDDYHADIFIEDDKVSLIGRNLSLQALDDGAIGPDRRGQLGLGADDVAGKAAVFARVKTGRHLGPQTRFDKCLAGHAREGPGLLVAAGILGGYAVSHVLGRWFPPS